MSTILLSSINAWSLHNFRSGLIDRLLERKDRVVVLAPKDAYSRALATRGCEVHDIQIDDKGANPFTEAGTLMTYWRNYRRIAPDLALHFTVKPVIYGTLAARVLRIPSIAMITGLGTPFLRETLLTRIVEQLYRIALRSPQKVFFQNRDDHELFLERGLVRQDLTARVPGSGVDLRHFATEPYPNGPMFRFLMIARLIRDKGVEEFVQAARRLRERHPQACFQLLGAIGAKNRTAIPREEVEAWIRQGVVEYLGRAADVRPYIAAADCVVLPSYREGTPRALLEASAMARPIITTDVPGCRQVVDAGLTGLLCRSRDALDLGEKMELMLSLSREERARMGLNARIKMEREFDERLVVEQLLGSIAEILRFGPRRPAKTAPPPWPPVDPRP